MHVDLQRRADYHSRDRAVGAAPDRGLLEDLGGRRDGDLLLTPPER